MSTTIVPAKTKPGKNKDDLNKSQAELSLQGQPQSILEFESPSMALIALPVPPFSRRATWILAGFVAAMMIVFYFAKLDIVVTANGKVVSTSDTVVIQPLDPSIIKSIKVQEGQIVHKGDLLATLDETLSASSLTQYQSQVKALTPELERLHAEQNHEIYKPKDLSDPSQALQAELFQQRRSELAAADEGYSQQIASLEQQIAGNLSQANYYKQRLGMASDVESMRRQEEQLQVGSKLNSLAAADQRVQMEGSMAQAQAAAQAERATLQSTIAQRDTYDSTWRATIAQSLHDEGITLATAESNLKMAGLHNGLVQMRAPVDAIVLQVEKLSVGSVLTPAEQFIQLTPLDGPLQLEVYVSGSDAGWVQKGDPGEIKFNTFNFESYGDATAKVVSVSGDSFLSPGSGASTGGISTSTSTADPGNSVSQSLSVSPATTVFYRVTMAFDKIRLHGVPRNFRLTPGLPVEADIVVGYRTIMDYIMGRVLPVFHDSLREP